MGVNNSNQKTRQVQRRWRQAMLLFPIMLLVMSAVGVIFSTAPAYAAPVVNVTTFAGTPATVGYADGLAASAQFSWPHDIAFDNAGTMYIADTMNNRIRTVSPSGVVSTFAGSGVAGGADGTGTAAQFSSPHSIAINPTTGIIYVTEASINPAISPHTPRIRAITPSGVVTTLAGSGVAGVLDGTGTAAQFFFPTGITVNPTTGMIYIADSYAHSIRAITPGGVVTTLAGFDNITDVAASPNGGYADGTGTTARFSYPQGLDVDSEGTLYVAEFGGDRVRKVTSTGVVTTIAGSGVRGYADGTGLAAQFNQPAGVVVTSSGTIYVSDTYNNRIRAITPDGVVTTIAGSGTTGYADGQGLSAEFNAPTGLVLDAAGTLYVTDTYNQLIRRVTITDPAANPDTPTDSGQSDTTPGVPNTGVKMTRDVGEVLFISGAVFALLVSISIYVFRAKKRSYKR